MVGNNIQTVFSSDFFFWGVGKLIIKNNNSYGKQQRWFFGDFKYFLVVKIRYFAI
jgi:hypothetical protein